MSEDLRRQIDSFVDALCEDRTDAEAFAKIEAAMRGNPDAQRYYLRQMELLQMLSWDAQSRMAHRAVTELRSSQSRRPILPWVALAAALLMLGFFLMPKPETPEPEIEEPRRNSMVKAEPGAEWTEEGDRLRLTSGVVALKVPVDADALVIAAGAVQLSGPGASLGISMVDGVKVAVLKGEVQAIIDSDYIGRRVTLRLNRDEGFELDAAGALTTAVIGDGSRFADLLATEESLLVNAGFELPLATTPQTAPAGWTLTSHPIANADGMEVDAGVMRRQNRQWAYLNAEVFKDGRSAYSSMHQAVGRLKSNARHRLRATVARPNGPLGDGGGYSISLVAGSALHGPSTPLQVWQDPVAIAPGKQAQVALSLRSPPHDANRADELFVVIAATPGGPAGLRQVLVDDVVLEIEEE